MKKFGYIIIGIIVGATLSVSTIAFGESISSIGKKIDAEYSIVVNGKTLDAKSIVVNGVSYTPNRAIADAISYDIAFKDQKIIMNKKEETLMDNEANTNIDTNDVSADDIRDARIKELAKITSSYGQTLNSLFFEWGDATDERKIEIELERNKIKEEIQPYIVELEKLQREVQEQQRIEKQ